MKILLIADSYLDLYKIIIEELEEEGHQVNYIEEIMFKKDPYLRSKHIYKWLKYLRKKRWEKKKIFEKYWEKKLSQPILNQTYDLLFVIQGRTFDNVLIKHLKKINPQLRTVIYIWDTNKYYDFFRNVRYFDKAFSFDYDDVREHKSLNVSFLPFFWPKSIENMTNIVKYDICSIGTNHHGRYRIMEKVRRQLVNENMSIFFKLLIIPVKKTIKDKIRLAKAYLINNKQYIDSYRLKTGDIKSEMVCLTPYTPIQLCEIVSQSKAIFETDNPEQSGTTPRLIWAMALNKHIYTTNRKIKNLNFYNEKFIHIVDYQKPHIDASLLEYDSDNSLRESVMHLRIDNWLKNFLFEC